MSSHYISECAARLRHARKRSGLDRALLARDRLREPECAAEAAGVAGMIQIADAEH